MQGASNADSTEHEAERSIEEDDDSKLGEALRAAFAHRRGNTHCRGLPPEHHANNDTYVHGVLLAEVTHNAGAFRTEPHK